MMKTTKFTDIFKVLGNDEALAENLKIRAELMHALRNYIESNELTQTEAAEIFDVSQPRVSDLVNGKIDKFTIDMLITMLSSAGIHVDVKVASEAA